MIYHFENLIAQGKKVRMDEDEIKNKEGRMSDIHKFHK